MFKIVRDGYQNFGDKEVNERFPTKVDAQTKLELIPKDIRIKHNFRIEEIEETPEERILLLEKKVFVLTALCRTTINAHRRGPYYMQKLKELEGDK